MSESLLPIYCHTDPASGFVWYADSEYTSEPHVVVAVNSKAPPVKFLSSRQLGNRTLRILGSEGNSQLLLAASGARQINCIEQLFVGSPWICEPSQLEFPAAALAAAVFIEHPVSCGGWHKYTESDTSHYQLCLRLEGGYLDDDHVFQTHPCHKLYECLAGDDTQLFARLWYLTNLIVDPRWHTSSSHPDSREPLFRQLGVDYPTADRLLRKMRHNPQTRKLNVLREVSKRLRRRSILGELNLQLPDLGNAGPISAVVIDACFLLELIDAYWRDQLSVQRLFVASDYFIGGVWQSS